MLLLLVGEVHVNFAENHDAFVFGSEAAGNDVRMSDNGKACPVVRLQALQFVSFGGTVKIDRVVFGDIADRNAVSVSVCAAHGERSELS